MSPSRYVLVTDHVFRDLDTERAMLGERGVELVEAPSTDEATLVRLANGAAGVLVCFAPVTEAVVAAAASGGCRIIARYGVGVDNVDVAAATRLGVLVTNVPDYATDEVADHAMALLLASMRQIVAASNAVREGTWEVPSEGVQRLRGRRLALVGLGRIGLEVARRAAAFGIETVAFDPFVESWPSTEIARMPTLEAAVSDADFISLHAALTDETRHVIGDASIGMMRRAPVIVNTARGGLVDLDAAARALSAGTISGLAVDVTEPEPLPSGHPLLRDPRVIVTPHMAFHSPDAAADLQRKAVQEVVDALDGRPPRRPVNPQVVTPA